ncbi:urease accessory protein UreF [Comamonas aquatica]|uniref:urease accessory protein UreF n=1 Tax=Comamonas aquatica TaxID=225991 RepID=UPI0005AAA6B2|nr:urease accessory UreF family protein [Comamonas aquatica]
MLSHPTAATFLQLMWLASPALPIGGFSYSEGLEAAIDSGRVTTEAEAAEWLRHQLHLTQSRGDMAAIAQALPAWAAQDRARLAQLNDWVRHTRESAELRLQTEQMGRSLIEWLKNRHAGDTAIQAQVQWLAAQDASYPLAFALAAHLTGAQTPDALLAYAFGWAENMVQAAIKAVPLGQSAGQRILARLTQEIPAAVELALALPDAERQAFSPMLAILSARHEHQYSRLFRS